MRRMIGLLIVGLLLVTTVSCSNEGSSDVTLYMMTESGVDQKALDELEQWVTEQLDDRFTFRAIGAPQYDKDELTIEVGVGKYELIILPEADFEEFVDHYVFEALEDYVSKETFAQGVRTVEVTDRLPNVPGTPRTKTTTHNSLFGIPLQDTVMEQELGLFDETLYMVIIPRLNPPIERVEALQLMAEGEIQT